MALGSTQPLTEMSTRNIPGDEGRPAREADNLTANCEPIVYKMWEPQHLTTLWVSTPRYRDRGPTVEKHSPGPPKIVSFTHVSLIKFGIQSPSFHVRYMTRP
jgi:hypothetical protein